ncbi:GNAT family N-acetyltransferase [Sulfitobacter pacificus]|uniref:GNAT family N-acetyltransferase n=1 Tax=Sulfitobacter pacificus TaxID=1499314 RepID=UPI00310A039A
MTALRAARSTDAGKVGAILTEFVATTDWMPQLHTGAEDIAHAGQLITRGWVTVAEVEGDVIGFAACDGEDLDALYVARSQRGQGVGTALLHHLQKERAVLKLWTFQANLAAQNFYLKHGFVEQERTDGASTDEGLPDIRFQWHKGSL